MHQWYVLHAKPQKERQVAEYLRQHELQVFLPLAKVNPVNPRAARERPFFPCYLFCRIDVEINTWAGLRWTPGLRTVVQFGGQPAAVPDHFIFELRRRLERIREAGGLRLEGLRHGDEVQIASGPFAGYAAVFDMRLSGSERVRVLLQIVQHENRRVRTHTLPVELNASSIEKVRRTM